MKKLLLAGLALLATASFTFAQDAKTAANEKVEKVDPITEIASATGIKIFMVGDSTVSAFHDPYYYPRFGYGTKIQHFLTDKAEVVNLAMSGRSSKSFTTEANYETLKKYLKKGDYLIIGFGHNDEKAEEARYTNPNGAKEDAGSFKNSLYESYIKLALERKATPVLCTPIVRRAPGKAYEGAVVHVTADQGADFPGGDYPKAIRELASETKVALVDLTAKTKALYEEKGDDEEHRHGSSRVVHLHIFRARASAGTKRRRTGKQVLSAHSVEGVRCLSRVDLQLQLHKAPSRQPLRHTRLEQGSFRDLIRSLRARRNARPHADSGTRHRVRGTSAPEIPHSVRKKRGGISQNA